MSGIAPKLPQPPRSRGGVIDSAETARWYLEVWKVLTGVIGVAWDAINKAGSKLSDVEDRTHAMLQDVKGWVTGADTAQVRHISNANGKIWQDHVEVLNSNPHGTDHAMLDAIATLDPTSSDSTQDKHLSNAQGKVWRDHVAIVNGNPHGTDHATLDAIAQADDTSASGTGGKHVTDAQVKKYEDHRLDATVHHTLEEIQDDIAGMLTAGNAIILTYDDAANTLTVAVTKAAASADVASAGAGATYTAAEQTLINELKTSLNDLKAKMRTAGSLA